jgi:DNA-nicking Smr family endonuclease
MKKRAGEEIEGDEDDALLWQKVARTVKAYSPKTRSRQATEKPIKTAAAKTRKTPVTPPPPVKQATAPPPPARLNTATERKIRRGHMPVESTIDLHGMTQNEAYDALSRFIDRAEQRGYRMLLVITGKGAKGDGVLKRMLPLWLEEAGLRRKIIGFSPAQQKDGGTGAFYVRLKKPS